MATTDIATLPPPAYSEATDIVDIAQFTPRQIEAFIKAMTRNLPNAEEIAYAAFALRVESDQAGYMRALADLRGKL